MHAVYILCRVCTFCHFLFKVVSHNLHLDIRQVVVGTSFVLCHKFQCHEMAYSLQTPLFWYLVLFIVMCWTANALCNEFSFKLWIDLYSLRPSGDVWFTYSGTAHLATWTMKIWRGNTGRISLLSRPSMVLMWAARSMMRWVCRWTERPLNVQRNVNGMCVITKDKSVFDWLQLKKWISKIRTGTLPLNRYNCYYY